MPKSDDNATLEALRREIERLRVSATADRTVLDAVFAHSPHGIIVCDASGKLILQNKAAERIWAGSATADDIAGWGKYRAFHPDGRPYGEGDWAMTRALLRGEIVVAEEYDVQRFDDSRGVLLGSCAPLRGASGAIEGALSIFADITTQKQLQRKLELETETLATTLRSIGDAVIATDDTARITFANDVAVATTGWSVREMVGAPLSSVFRIVNEDTRQPAENPVERVVREGRIVELANHTLLIRKDGSEVAIDDSAAPVRDRDGKLQGVVLVFRDVTEKRQEENRRQFMIEASRLLASSLDHEATLASVARLAVPRIADWCAVDLLTDAGDVHRLAVAHVDPEKVALVHDIQRRFPPDRNAPRGVHHVLRTGVPEVTRDITDEVLVVAIADPEHRDLVRRLGLRSAMVHPLRARGRTLGAITFVTAESGRRFGDADVAFAEELSGVAATAIDNARLYQASQRALKSREDLLAIVSHDLRNPLNVVLSKAAINLARIGESDAGARKDFEVIQRACERMETLIGDLLDMSRIESGTFAIRTEAHSPSRIVRSALELLRPLAAKKTLRLDAKIGETAQVTCDPARVMQVFSNLIGNAIKFTPDGGAIALECLPDGEHVRFTVKDTGRGIPPEQLPRIFERLWQGEASGEKGMGLGLYIAKGIIDAHQGRLWVESAVGEGTAFHFTLPAA